MQKFITTKRINEANIKEVDQRVQMESYLREKKEAILEDRKLDIGLAAKGPRIMLKDHDDDDQKSCLQQV